MNQGSFIEATIRSVVGQGYANLQYMVIDGGSTDGTIEILKRYQPWISLWISEADRGQSHAINKGSPSPMGSSSPGSTRTTSTFQGRSRKRFAS